MKANATLLVGHFYWKEGTRVEVLSYWVTERHVTVQFPETPSMRMQRWTIPTEAVQLDEGVKLEIEGELPKLR